MIDDSIENLNLSARAYNCLKSAGVKTIYEMALIDLKNLRNCGKKTIDEINEKISSLREEGRYSQNFINENFDVKVKHNFIDSLKLSVRSKNILKELGIRDENDLLALDYDKLRKTKNAGITSFNEIKNYIENNRNDIEITLANNGTYVYSIPVNLLKNFCGNTFLDELPLNPMLKEKLKRNNISTILDLLLNKMSFDNFIMPLYNVVYEYFHNIAYGPLILTTSNDLSNLYVNIPFSILELKENYYIKICDLIKYIINHFDELELEDKLNSKLFLYWINSFEIPNKKKYLLDKLMLRDNEYKILSLRSTKTLEEVGKIFGITRERVRQLEAKAIKKISQKYKSIPFRFIDNKKIYYLDEIDDFDNFLFYIDKIIGEGYHKFVRNGEESYYLPNFYIDKMNNFIRNNISQLENQGYIEIDMQDWNNSDILKKVIKYLDYNLNGNKLTKKLSKRLQVRYAMKHLCKPIKISSNDDQKELVKMVKELFGNELEPGRALEALIEDAGVRIDSGKYAVSDNVEDLSSNTLLRIVQYVNNRKIINTRDLFIDFGDELIAHNLNNETILYRYLKDTLSNKLYFHGVSAVISSDPSLSGWGDWAIRLMQESHKPINKLDFIVEYSLTDAIYNQLPIYFDDIIVWSKKEIYLKSLLDISKSVKDEIINYIKTEQIVKFDTIRKKINQLDINLLSVNNVKTNENLSNFLLNILPEDFTIDKRNEEVRYRENIRTTINEIYEETEELTL